MKRVDPGTTAAAGSAGTRPARVSLRWRVGGVAAGRLIGLDRAMEAIVELELTELEQIGAGSGLWRTDTFVVADGRAPRAMGTGRVEARCVLDRGLGLLHMDAGTTLRATFELRDAGPIVLYAKTPLLGELGLAGGRYEVAGGEVDFVGIGR